MAKEYIERSAISNFPVRQNHCDMEHASPDFISGVETVIEYAESLQAADVEEVVHAYWKEYFTEKYHQKRWKCSACGIYSFKNADMLPKYKRCPECGARMSSKPPRGNK